MDVIGPFVDSDHVGLGTRRFFTQLGELFDYHHLDQFPVQEHFLYDLCFDAMLPVRLSNFLSLSGNRSFYQQFN